jgi:glycine/D-amino acid oxidase-like deaminating enzyme
LGAVLESLSARVHPRQAVAALAAALQARGAGFQTGTEVLSLHDGAVRLPGGCLKADAIILAAGTGSTALMEPLLGLALGKGIKGQAALLRPAKPVASHLIYSDGIYIVPHADGTVAVGSTSEREFTSPAGTDAQLDALIARARAICPGLANAPVVETWAALRPRGARPMPMLGRLPGTERVFVAGGGFKIGFGIAHKAGQVLADMIAGHDPALPPVFTVAEHLAAQLRDNSAA